MSTAFIATPLGGLPKQDIFIIKGLFNTGFYEFDKNFVLLSLKDTLTFFNKNENEQNLEIYLKNPIRADSFKK